MKKNKLTREEKRIKKSDIKKGFKFYWNTGFSFSYGGIYEVICFTKDLSLIFCHKPTGRRATIKEDGSLAKFDEKIINNKEFLNYA